MQYSKVSLIDIINEIPLVFTEISARKKVPLRIELSPKMPKALFLDGLRLRQVLLNLVSNALKFTESGEVVVSVECVFNMQSTAKLIDIEIKVKDSGIGIPPTQQSKIFEAFRQIDGQSSKKYGGTGLGLAITHSLVKLMNGKISVESQLEKGSTFTIKINNVEYFENEFIKVSPKIDFQKLVFSPSKILHVEDVQANRELIALFLEVYPEILIEEAENGLKALEKLKTFKPDLILMDIEMPLLNGIETSKRIRETPELSHIPIIALTANATKEEINKYQTYFNNYITKPISEEYLFQTLASYLPCKKQEINSPEIFISAEEHCINDLIKLKNEKKFSQAFNSEFNKKILPLHSELLDILSVDTLKQFAVENQQLALKYKVEPLGNFSKLLAEAISDFNLAKINHLLKLFDGLKE
jgi:CheY-like chemotaxis protein